MRNTISFCWKTLLKWAMKAFCAANWSCRQWCLEPADSTSINARLDTIYSICYIILFLNKWYKAECFAVLSWTAFLWKGMMFSFHPPIQSYIRAPACFFSLAAISVHIWTSCGLAVQQTQCTGPAVHVAVPCSAHDVTTVKFTCSGVQRIHWENKWFRGVEENQRIWTGKEIDGVFKPSSSCPSSL